jgi:membrane-bound lytic murein transglycosylase B
MKLIKLLIILNFIFYTTVSSFADENDKFNKWKNKFKKIALSNDISEETLNIVMTNVKYLPKVIEYDRYQPEFYEDTKTYLGKRTSKKKLNKGIKFYEENTDLINKVEKRFDIEKELLLALMGIETNFGTYVGKMDILSSLATLSYDQRRSEFFSNELIILLKLIDSKQVDYTKLYGSWAGAFGFFQFMPSTIKNYALDFNKDDRIDLKNNEDSYASAANYLKNIGWKKNEPCFYKIKLNKNTPTKYLNISAKKLHSKKSLKKFKKYIDNYSDFDFLDETIKVAIVTPDKDIVVNAETFNPAYIVFENYEIILKWNRSLRFALAVCTLKNKFKNEI